MEKEEAVKKTPAITISPSFLYGVTSGVKVILSSFPIHLASSFDHCSKWGPPMHRMSEKNTHSNQKLTLAGLKQVQLI